MQARERKTKTPRSEKQTKPLSSIILVVWEIKPELWVTEILTFPELCRVREPLPAVNKQISENN